MSLSILALAVAVNCIQAPPRKPHHKAIVPVQSCAAPVPYMLQPEPDALGPITVYVRYPMIEMCYQDAPPLSPYMPSAASVPDMPDTAWNPGFGGIVPYAASIPWGESVPVDSAPPPLVVPPWQPTAPRIIASPPHQAPEIDPASGFAAVTLLAGALAVMRGRK